MSLFEVACHEDPPRTTVRSGKSSCYLGEPIDAAALNSPYYGYIGAHQYRRSILILKQ